jgi:urease accessory protein
MAFAGNLLSASIRLSVIGQTDSQRVTAALLPQLQEAATRAADSTLDDIASATFAADLASMQHETQYTRLFRS